MTEHRAKTAALLAYAEGLLSDEGTRRIEAHLDGCEVCQQELMAIQLYDRMVDDVSETEVPEVDFSKMGLTLAREAKRVSLEIEAAQAPSGRWGFWAAGALAVAAALALFFGGSFFGDTPSPSPRVAETPTPETTPTPDIAVEPDDLAPQLTLAAGAVQRAAGEVAPTDVSVGQTLAEGDALAVDGLAHVRLDEGIGFVLASNDAAAETAPARVQLARADIEGVQLDLMEGRLDSTVAGEDARVEGWRRESTFVVLAGRYEVRAQGAHGSVRFVTSYIDGDVTVGAHAGRLSIHRDGNEVARLEAPGQWSSRPGSLSDAAEARTVRGLGAALPDADATLVTLSHADLVRWSLDGTDIAHGGPVRLRVRNGSHRVTGWTLAGRSVELDFEATGAPTMMDEGTLEVRPPPRMRAGHLEPHVIAQVVGRGMRSVQQCWRRALRENTEGQQGNLQVTIGSLGDVSRVRVTGLSGAELRQCIENYARRWEFPPPGGPVTFSQPLRFSPSM